MLRDLDPSLAGGPSLPPALPPATSPGAERVILRVGLARAAGALAALLAAAHGLAAFSDNRLPILAGWHAHGMNAWLALALAAIGSSSALSAKGRLAARLRVATAAVSLVAILSLGSGFAHDGEAGVPLVSLVWIAVLMMLVRSLWPVVTPIRASRLLLLQAGIGLLWAIWVAALSMLVTGGLLLDWEPLAGGICWPGVLILGLLSTSASVRLARQPAVRGFYAARDDRRIFAGFLGMLFGAVTVASSLIAGMLTSRTVEAIGPMLHHSVGGHALAVDHLIARLTDAASRAADVAPLRGPTDRASPAALGALALNLRELRQQLDPLGQVGIRLILPGAPALTEGSLHDGPWASLMERDSMSVMAQNRDGLVLQVMKSLPVPGAVLAIQVRPLRPDAQLQPVELLDTTAVVMLCADERPVGAHCVKRQAPNDFTMRLPRREDGLQWPIERAWQGLDGVMLLRDPDRSAAVIAYAPVGTTGLGVVQKLLVAPLVQRLGRSVLAALGMLLLVAGVGAWLLYRRSYPVLLGLRYAKAEGQTTLDHLPEGVLTLDARGAILSSSVGAHRLFGCSADVLLGQDLASLVLDGHEGERPWQATPGVHRARVIGADGAPIPVEAEVEPLVFEGARRQVVILRDLRTELAHRAELARWERVFFHAPWGVMVSSAEDDRLQLLNPALAAMHGWTVDELRGRTVLDLVAPAHREAARAAVERMHDAGPSRFETWHVHRDGHEFPVQVDAALVRRDDAGPDDRVVNIQDITERRHAEESLRHSEALLQLVLKSLPVGVWICDEAARVVATNPAAERIWGGPIELVAGRPVGRRLRRLASGQPIVEGDSPVQRALRTGEAVFGEAIEIDQPDGVCRALYSSVPLVGDDGRTLGAIAVTEDLTALLRAEAAVLAASRFFESLFHSAAAGMAVCDASGRFVRVNHALCELLGRPEEQLLASAPADLSDRDTVREDQALARIFHELRVGSLVPRRVAIGISPPMPTEDCRCQSVRTTSWISDDWISDGWISDGWVVESSRRISAAVI